MKAMKLFDLIFKKDQLKKVIVGDVVFYSKSLNIIRQYLLKYTNMEIPSDMLGCFVKQTTELRSIGTYDYRWREKVDFLKEIRLIVLELLMKQNVANKNLLKEFHKKIHLAELGIRYDYLFIDKLREFLNVNYRLNDEDAAGHAIRMNFDDLVRINPCLINFIKNDISKNMVNGEFYNDIDTEDINKDNYFNGKLIKELGHKNDKFFRNHCKENFNNSEICNNENDSCNSRLNNWKNYNEIFSKEYIKNKCCKNFIKDKTNYNFSKDIKITKAIEEKVIKSLKENARKKIKEEISKSLKEEKINKFTEENSDAFTDRINNINTNINKYHDIVEKNKSISKNDHDIIEKNKSISNNDHDIVETNKSINNNDHDIVETNKSISKNDHDIIEKNKSISNNDHDIVETNKSISNNDHDIVETNKSISNNDHDIVETNKSISNNDHDIVEKNKSISNNDHDIIKRNKSINNNDHDIIKRNKSISNNDHDIIEKNKSINNNDHDIIKRNKSINKNDHDIVEKNKSINKNDHDIVEKNKSINKNDHDIVEKNKSISKNDHINKNINNNEEVTYNTYKIQEDLWNILTGNKKWIENDLERACYEVGYKGYTQVKCNEIDIIRGDVYKLINGSSGWLRLVLLFVSGNKTTLVEFENIFESIFYDVCELDYQTALDYLAFSRGCQYHFNVLVKKIKLNSVIVEVFMNFIRKNKLDSGFLIERYTEALRSAKDYDGLCRFIAYHRIVGHEYTLEELRYFVENYKKYTFLDEILFMKDKNNMFISMMNTTSEKMGPVFDFLITHKYSEFFMEEIVTKIIHYRKVSQVFVLKVLEIIFNMENKGKWTNNKIKEKLLELLLKKK